MIVDKDTKLIARLHKEANGTGLNIYNPYFQDQALNAVYLLFKNQKAEPLLESMRNLQIVGAITAGFEHDATLPSLVDECLEAVKIAGRIGMIANRSGVLWAHYQGGEGLLAAIREKADTAGKRVVIVGAGTVAKTFILALVRSDRIPKEVLIYNRTVEKAKEVKRLFPIVVSVHPLEEINKAEGDMLVNASRIGSSAPDEVYNAALVARFAFVADVTFGSETTNLTSLAKAQKRAAVSGWDMFTHQAAVVLREILGHEANIPRLGIL